MRDREFATLLTVLVSIVFRSTGVGAATVGFVTTDKDAGPLDIAAFQRAVEDINGNSSTTEQGVHLAPAVRLVHQHDPLQVASAVCSLLDAGVSAIVDGTAPPRSSIAAALCRRHTVPCLAVKPYRHHGDEQDVHSNGTQENFSVNLQPAESTVGKAASKVLRHMGWSTITILYDTLDNLAVAENILTDPYFDVTLIKVENKQDISSFLRPALQSGPARVMLTLNTRRLKALLLAGTNIKETREYFVPDPDVELTVLREMSGQNLRVTTLRMGNAEDSLQGALLRDAVHVVAAGVRGVAERLQERGGLCKEQQAWQQGSNLLAAITHTRLTGASGPLWFNTDGSRSPVNLQVVELTDGIARHIASWSSSDEVLSWGGQAISPLLRQRRDLLQLTGGVRPKLRVALVLSSPYVMVKDPAPSSLASQNDLYEGFCVDLLDGIAKVANFDYELVLNEEDARYGSYDPTSGEWTGMVGDLVDQRVDVAIGDLSVTEERNAVVDFTDPWLSFGIGLLTYNHDFDRWQEGEDFFMFLQPFSLPLWLLLLATTLLMALLLFALARLSPCERSSSTFCCEPRNTQSWTPFTLCTSVWFAAGTLFRQFVVVQPRACSTRLLALLWWFFVVVVAAFYVVSLISCRSVSGSILNRTPSVQSLYDLPKQRIVKFGAVYGGSTWAFFRDTKSETLQWVYSSMSNQAASSRVMHYADAIERIIEQEGHYAFLMEEPSIEYIVLRQCDVEQRGGTVGSRSFAIALQQDSVYLDEFNSALSDLRKSGELDRLHDKWWRSQRGGGQCSQTRDELWLYHPIHESVTVDSLAGMFIVLVVGAAVAVVIAVAECCWEASKLSKQNKSTLATEVAQQLRLATTGQRTALPAANSAEQ